MLIFYCSSRRFLLATRGHNKKWGEEEASWKNLPTPLIFSFSKKKNLKKNVVFKLIGKMAFMNTFLFRFCWYIRNRKLVMEKVVWSGFFERNKRVFSSAIRCMSLQKCYKQKKLLRKKKKENIGMWVSKQWWIFFKRQRQQQQACFAHRTRERETVLQLEKNIFTGWTAIAPLLLCSSEPRQIFINAKSLLTLQFQNFQVAISLFYVLFSR